MADAAGVGLVDDEALAAPRCSRGPAWSSAAARRGRSGESTTVRGAASSSRLASVPVFTSRPREMITTSSTLCCTSLSRCELTSTVRPSCARRCRKPRIHLMPSGSRPLIGSSSTSTPGSPSRVYASDEALAHAERVAADPAVGELGEAHLLEHDRHAGAGQPRRRGVHLQVVAGRATGMEVRVERRPHRLEGPAAGRDTACRRTWPCPRSRARARAAPAASWSCLRRSDRGTRSPGRAPP